MDQNDSEDSPSVQGEDGFANALSKILHQNVGNKVRVFVFFGPNIPIHCFLLRKTPILAKRKTVIMKEIENENKDKLELKKRRLVKAEGLQKNLVIPDQTTADFERQLRKLATRGGLCLFINIILNDRFNSSLLF